MPLTSRQKDERQTKALNELRNYLQSMAILAVAAQDTIGNPDQTSDHLDLIGSDLSRAWKCIEILNDFDGK